jgi:hypothetical protein
MVDELGGRPGKWFMFEVKTTEWESRNGYNRLSIDLEQLDVYLSTGMPVFYVFPVPPWDDILTAALPWLGRCRRSDLGNPSAGNQWFAHWTYVLSASEVAARLKHSWPTNKKSTLFTSSVSNRAKRFPKGARTLNQFLHLQAQCGDDRSQAAIVAPRQARGSLRQPSRVELASVLRELTLSNDSDDRRLAHFLPTGQGDQYAQTDPAALEESLAQVQRGSARLVTVALDAADLAIP